MKKAEVELVRFDSADVIATSGESVPVCESTNVNHVYRTGKDTGYWYPTGKNSGRNWVDIFDSGNFVGDANGWYVAQGEKYVPCGKDHTGW